MEKLFARPKRFGEILDVTFKLIKEQFGKLFFLLLIFYSPIFVMQIFIQVFSGRGWIRDLEPGQTYVDQIINMVNTEDIVLTPAEIFENVALLALEMLIFPIAVAGVLLIVKRIKDQQDFELKEIIKQPFSRFFPLIGSTLLLGIIAFAMIFVPIFVLTFITLHILMANQAIGLLILFLVFIAVLIGVSLLLVRWGFYLPIVLFDRAAPGLGRSFRLTQGRTWMIFGLFLTLTVISGFMTNMISIAFIFLGNSVLNTILTNLMNIITTMIVSVGYAVIYFDLEIRHTASDLKEMIDDYHTTDEDPIR
ncbi:hypothetical protein [Amphibacillus cookii]|uniref:hypothetical protein n=1 Tax=Amphibacillus cookii TaxID=767787 RepID=UPI001959F95E|nr:hypothetical protein [Amphibacillus cookii]MBM7542081.1 hypothetical protein [Amphibacillus cookii]